MSTDDETLAQQLLVAGRITPEQLANCRTLAAQQGTGLRQVFAAYGLVPPSGLTRSLASGSGEPPVGGPPLGDGIPRQVGRYEVVRELGRGGMGIVLLARDPQLGRAVAIKMILTQGEVPARRLQRFQQESLAVAKLRHPGVVPVHEVGEHEGRPYLVMEYVEGQTLQALRQAEELSPRRAAQLTRELADVLHAAHQQGIVHRDVKPENVMLDASGRVRLMDFGLARDLAREGELTKTGAMLGTPFYMAPEQARGDRLAATPSADVYSLGAVLYFLVAGRPPYLAEGVLELLTQLQDRDPDALGSVARVHGDLEAIAHRALEREPVYRYRSAEEVRDELDHFLAGEPIEARPPGRVERWKRWARRHRVQAMLALVALLVLLSVLALAISAGVYAVQRIREARDRAEHALRAAEASEEEAQASATQALAAEREAQVAEREARAAAEREAQVAAKLERELASGRTLLRRARIERAQRLASEGQPAPACALALDLLAGGEDPALRKLLGEQWFAATRLRWTRPARLRERVSGAFHPQSGRVALGLNDGRVFLVDVQDHWREVNVGHKDGRKRVLHTLVPHEGWVLDLDFAADGRLLTAGADGWLKVWGADGKRIQALQASDSAISKARFVDALAVVYADTLGVIRRWDLTTKQTRTLWANPDQQPVLALAVTSAGVFCGDAGGRLLRLDEDRVAWERVAHAGPVLDVDVLGAQLLSADGAGGLVVQSLAGEVVWSGKHPGVTAAGFSDPHSWTSVDRQGAVVDWTRAEDGSVSRTIRAPTAAEYWTGTHELRQVGGLELSVGPQVMLTVPGSRRFSGRKKTRVVHLPSEFNRRAVAVAPQQDLATLSYSNGHLDLVQASDGSPLARLRGERATEAMAFSPDGTLLAAVERKGRMVVWDLATRKARKLFQAPGEPIGMAVAFGPRGRYVAGAFKRSVLCVADLETGEARRIPFAGGLELLDSVAFDASAEHVYLSRQGQVLAFALDGTPAWTWSPPAALGGKQLGGKTYLARVRNELIVVIGATVYRLGFTGELRGTLSPLSERVRALAAGNGWLAAASADGGLLLWQDLSLPPFALRVPDARLLAVGRRGLVVAGYRSGLRAFAPPRAVLQEVPALASTESVGSPPQQVAGGSTHQSAGGRRLTWTAAKDGDVVWTVTDAEGATLWTHRSSARVRHDFWDAQTLFRCEGTDLALVDALSGETLVTLERVVMRTSTPLASLDGRYLLLRPATTGELVVLDRDARQVAWRQARALQGVWSVDAARLLVCNAEQARVRSIADGVELASVRFDPALELRSLQWNGVELIGYSLSTQQAWRWDLAGQPRLESLSAVKYNTLTADGGGRLVTWSAGSQELQVAGAAGQSLGTLDYGVDASARVEARLVAPGVWQVLQPNRTVYLEAFPLGREPRELAEMLHAQSGEVAHGFDVYFAPGWPDWLRRSGGRGLPLDLLAR